MIRHLPVVTTVLAAVTLVAAPLPFGSVTPRAEAALEAAAFVLAALALLGAQRREMARVAIPATALLGVALLGVLQGLAWPERLIATVSPEHARLYREAAEVLPPEVDAPPPTLSLAPEVSRRTALSWAAMAAWLTVGAGVGSWGTARRTMLWALLSAAAFEVLYGMRRWMARDLTIWGVEVPESSSRLRGTFVNPDHLATYLLILLALAFAWLWWGGRKAARAPLLEARIALVAPAALVWLTLFAALAFTGSRAGLAAALGGVLVQGALLPMGRRRSTRRWRSGPVLALALLVVGVGAVVWIGFEEGFGRLLLTSSYEITANVRLAVYRETLGLALDFPLLGSGLGTFRDAFPLVQPADLEGTWLHAHNDYLELLLTVGVVGMVVVLLGLTLAVGTLLVNLRRGLHSEDRAVALAALGALAAVGIQEALDFGLTLPANGATLAMVVGAGLTLRRGRSPSGPVLAVGAGAPAEAPSPRRNGSAA
jgi:O-antigen ligase